MGIINKFLDTVKSAGKFATEKHNSPIQSMDDLAKIMKEYMHDKGMDAIDTTKTLVVNGQTPDEKKRDEENKKAQQEKKDSEIEM